MVEPNMIDFARPEHLVEEDLEILIEPYRNIKVLYMKYLNGGGRGFGQEYVRVIKEKFGHVGHVFEYCAGPGFIGFSLLAHGLCDRLTLADINPDAVECCKRTIAENGLSDRVRVYLSDCLEQIPASEKWDLAVSNPPHWPSDEKQYKENIRNFDPYLRVHKLFYEKIRQHLTPDGGVLFQELSDATSVEDFRPMIEGNGMRILETYKARPLTLWECVTQFKNIRKKTKPSAFYFIWSKPVGA